MAKTFIASLLYPNDHREHGSVNIHKINDVQKYQFRLYCLSDQ